MKKTAVALLLVLTMAFCFLTACSVSTGNDSGDLEVTIILVDQDESQYTYDIICEPGSTLRNALHDNGLIDDENFSAYFVETIDGHTADVENDGCTWVPYDTDNEMITGTFDDITFDENQTIYLIYTVVPNFDD